MDPVDENIRPCRLLRRSEAAKYVEDTYGIPCAPKTLAKLACVSSDGPPFQMAGKSPCIRSRVSMLGLGTRSDRWSARPLKFIASLSSQTKSPVARSVLAGSVVRAGLKERTIYE